MLLSLKINPDFNVIKGLRKDGFDPSLPFIGIKKPSGGLVYFNLLGTRIQPTIKTLNSKEMIEHTEEYGSVFLISSGQSYLLEGAIAGEIIPWKGLWVRRYTMADSFWYIIHSGEGAVQ